MLGKPFGFETCLPQLYMYIMRESVRKEWTFGREKFSSQAWKLILIRFIRVARRVSIYSMHSLKEFNCCVFWSGFLLFLPAF